MARKALVPKNAVGTALAEKGSDAAAKETPAPEIKWHSDTWLFIPEWYYHRLLELRLNPGDWVPAAGDALHVVEVSGQTGSYCARKMFYAAMQRITMLEARELDRLERAEKANQKHNANQIRPIHRMLEKIRLAFKKAVEADPRDW